MSFITLLVSAICLEQISTVVTYHSNHTIQNPTGRFFFSNSYALSIQIELDKQIT